LAVIACGILVWFLKLDVKEPEAPTATIDESIEDGDFAPAESGA